MLSEREDGSGVDVKLAFGFFDGENGGGIGVAVGRDFAAPDQFFSLLLAGHSLHEGAVNLVVAWGFLVGG